LNNKLYQPFVGENVFLLYFSEAGTTFDKNAQSVFVYDSVIKWLNETCKQTRGQHCTICLIFICLKTALLHVWFRFTCELRMNLNSFWIDYYCFQSSVVCHNFIGLDFLKVEDWNKLREVSFPPTINLKHIFLYNDYVKTGWTNLKDFNYFSSKINSFSPKRYFHLPSILAIEAFELI
jgi:hypothetical protein